MYICTACACLVTAEAKGSVSYGCQLQAVWVLGSELRSSATASLQALLLSLWDKVLLYSPGWPAAQCVAQAGLKPVPILLPQPLPHWDHRHVPSYLFWLFVCFLLAVLGIKPQPSNKGYDLTLQCLRHATKCTCSFSWLFFLMETYLVTKIRH